MHLSRTVNVIKTDFKNVLVSLCKYVYLNVKVILKTSKCVNETVLCVTLC